MMDNTTLRHVLLRGPLLASGEPLWELRAAAPDAFLDKQTHLAEDDTHPLRALLIDAGGADGQDGFRYPHLVSLHLIAGHGSGKYRTQFDSKKGLSDLKATSRVHPVGFARLPANDWEKSYIMACEEGLSVNAFDATGGLLTQVQPSKRRWQFAKLSDGATLTTSAYFITGPVPASAESPRTPAAAAFQHVLAEPCLNPDEPWPGEVSKAIEVPSFALVAGRIDLAVADGAFPWLGALQPKAVPESTRGKICRYPLTLTPEGIEMQCAVGFPGVAGTLSGPFLLSADGQRLVLTLQPHRLSPDQRQHWLSAWASVLPGSSQEEALQGFRLSGDAQQVPAFRYSLSVARLSGRDGNWPGLVITSETRDLPVEIPARHLRLNLLSPSSDQRVDGVVNCGGGDYFLLATPAVLKNQAERYFGSDVLYRKFVAGLDADRTLVLAWASPRPQAVAEGVVAPYLKLESHLDTTSPELKIDLVTTADRPYAVTLDEHRLADVLRRAYGLPPLAAGQFDNTRFLLPGFLPMSDGWLQLPFPNLPPLNLELDSELLSCVSPAETNALDGYLRFMPADDMPQVLSAFEPRPAPGLLIKQAPWSVTLEGAGRLRVALALYAETGTVGRTPLRGHAVVDQPDLSTRGLLWLSSDRPDAFEAIPRLGAGPGAFIDLPLERREQEQSVVSIAINQLSLTSKLHGQRATVTRDSLALSIDFNTASAAWGVESRLSAMPKVYYWSRHPQMPLAAQMPMTRMVSAAVRPLESRDLLPLEMRYDGKPAYRVADLAWSGEQVFAELQGSWQYKLPTRWPLPPEPQKEPLDPLQTRGIGLIAFGVPGAELAPWVERWEGQRWQSLRAALRYDLPVLDEAFAMASLPRATEEPGTRGLVPEQLDAPPTATALDWSALEQFWQEQERRLQLARVAHSYIGGYKALNDFATVGIDSLVGGLRWNAPTTGFGLDPKSMLPYGWMQLGNQQPLAGNEALLGLEKTFSVSSGQLTIDGAAPSEIAVQVLGNSPSSFLRNGFLTDARGVGARPLDLSHGWWRALSGLSPADAQTVGRFSSPQMLGVKEHDGDAHNLLRFWFKDLPLTRDGSFKGRSDVDTLAWQDGQLQQGGFEWRLLPASASSPGFASGSERIALGDMFIEPLRLAALQAQFKAGVPRDPVPQSLTIVARLHIGTEREDVDDGGNLLNLGFTASTAGHLLLKTVGLHGDAPLRFPIMVGSRLVTLLANAVSLVNRQLTLVAPCLAFDFAGQPVQLPGATQSAGPTFTWSGTKAQPGKLVITAAKLMVNQSGSDQGSKARLNVDHELAIAPGPADDGVTVLRVKASGELESDQHDATLFLLDSEVAVQVVLARGAVSLTSLRSSKFRTALVKGFPETGCINFGLIASIAAFSDSNAPLQSVHFCGVLRKMCNLRKKSRCSLSLDRVLIEGGGIPGNWHGELTLHGKLAGQSTIGWPQVSPLTAADEQVPFPGNAPNGRRKLRIENGPGHTHEVEWLLDGHRMSMYTAGCINRADSRHGIWTATVMARHSLTRDGGQPLRFTAVDSIALGAMAALIPPWPSGADAEKLERDARSTFAARYRHADLGITWPGRGGLGSVLHGAQGKAFRQAIYSKDEQPGNVVVIGGFVGLIEQAGSDVAPLLRLPSLMGLSASYLGSGSEQPLLMQCVANKHIDIDVAWPDSLAALPIAPTFSCAASPATANERDLEVAVSIGSRPLQGDSGARSRLAGALLVEQSFATDFKAQSLEQTPYFFASAAALSRVLNGRTVTAAAPRVLSVVSQVHCDSKEQNPQRRAAALLTSGNWNQLIDTASAPTDRGELLVAGDRVLVQPWPGLDFSDHADDGFDAQVAMKAHALQSRPRVALLRDRHGEFRTVPLPQPTLQPRARVSLEQQFADAGRGYLLPVHTGEEMAGVEEGFSAALRDDKVGGSGIAALSRRVNLPALATSLGSGFSAENAVWLAQQRAPLYLPILSRFACEPIPWLVPAAPRSRVPVVRALDEHLKRLGTPERVDIWQPLLASQAMLAAISERPGILLARHLRLEVGAEQGVNAVDAFDALFPRFGAPAQASAALARVERTPRPGPFAENKGDQTSDRRPCASPLLPTLNHRAWVGPADSLGGSSRRANGTVFDWTVTLVAAPETSGTITSSWDGSLRLIAEIDEKPGDNTGEPGSWADELLQLLFGAPALPAKPPYRLQASASLEINGHSLPFRSLHVLPLQGPRHLPNGVQRGYASIVLDMREADLANGVPGPALVTIAELLATTDATPSAQLKLTVHPTAVVLDDKQTSGPFALAADDKALPGGDSNAPVMLRFALWPLLRERGALALEPTSLLFIDPAYDAGLSAPPHQVTQRGEQHIKVFAADRQRVNRQGSVTLMAYTQPLISGDVDKLPLALKLLPRSGEVRELTLASAADTLPARLVLEQIHELSLGRLLESDGQPAGMAAGDLLELAVTFPDNATLRLTLMLTDEPVAEPPPGLYAALSRTVRGNLVQLSLPLYAQSPLPWRVDLIDAAAGFRAGLLRRSARFMWTLARPADETAQRGVHIVKADRNGQTYLPHAQSIDSDFIAPQRIVELLAKAGTLEQLGLAADTDDTRRARIKGFWPALNQMLKSMGDADEKAQRIKRLLLYIGGMESHFGLYRDQFGGPAKGLLQLQCGTLKDIVAQADVMDRGNVAGRKDRIEKLHATQKAFVDSKALLAAAAGLPASAGFPPDSAFIGLARDNDVFAATVLRLQLMRDSIEVPNSHETCYQWWLANWHGPVNVPADSQAKFLQVSATADSDLRVLKLS
jgi:hypothetical protein